MQVLRKELKEAENREGGLKAKLEGEGKEKQRYRFNSTLYQDFFLCQTYIRTDCCMMPVGAVRLLTMLWKW